MGLTELEPKWLFVLRRYLSNIIAAGVLAHLVHQYIGSRTLVSLITPFNIYLVLFGCWVNLSPRRLFQFKKDKHEPGCGWGDGNEWACSAEQDTRKKIKEIGYRWWEKNYVLESTGSRCITIFEKAISMKKSGEAETWLKEKPWAKECYDFLLDNRLEKYQSLSHINVRNDLDLKFLLQMDRSLLESIIADEIVQLSWEIDNPVKNRPQLHAWLGEEDMDALKHRLGCQAFKYTSKRLPARLGRLFTNRRKRQLVVNFYHFLSFCQVMGNDINRLNAEDDSVRNLVMSYFSNDCLQD